MLLYTIYKNNAIHKATNTFSFGQVAGIFPILGVVGAGVPGVATIP
jgi:hypothetical protein